MSLTKEHLVFSVYNHLNIPRTKSIDLVESVLEIIKRSLAKGEDVLMILSARDGKVYKRLKFNLNGISEIR